MTVLLILSIVFGTLVNLERQPAAIQEQQQRVAVKQKATDLGVSLAADKRSYRRSDDINLEVKLTNTHGVRNIFVYGTLELGYHGSFMFYHRDAKGKDVSMRFFPEALTLPPKPNDTSAFVKLLPDHFLGTYFRSTIRTLNMVRPGRYSMWVEYECPISIADVKVSPFWGTENGVVKSNVVQIEVIR